MAHYRLYAMTSDYHIISGHDLDAADDDEAIRLTRLRVEHSEIELWCGKRKVALVRKDGVAVFLNALTPGVSEQQRGQLCSQ
jgi:hypothetical protein